MRGDRPGRGRVLGERRGRLRNLHPIPDARRQARIRKAEARPARSVSALRSDGVARLARDDGPLQPSLSDQRDLAEIHHPDFPGERLIACLNPLLRDERHRRREALLAATEADLEKVRREAARRTRTTLTAEEIGQKVGKVIGRHQMSKHFGWEGGDGCRFRYWRETRRIAAEERLDGVYVIRTSVPEPTLDASAAVRTCKSLARVERAFRCLKTVDLHLRPIHHRLSDRVRTQVFLCMLACYVEWHMRRAWAPLLFAEDDPEGAARRRGSPVAKAEPSVSAANKAATRHTPQGQPIHHFRGWIDLLATLTRNTMKVKDSRQTFQQLTVPTELQRHALELLKVPVAMSSERGSILWGYPLRIHDLTAPYPPELRARRRKFLTVIL